MFTFSFHDSIVSRLILNQGKDASLRKHHTHRMIQGTSNAYTGQSMLKRKRAQATLVLEGPVGGLVIAMKSYARVHQAVAPYQQYLEEWLAHGNKIVEMEKYSSKTSHLN